MNEYTTRKIPIKNHRHRNVAIKMMGPKVVIGFPPKFPLKVKYTLNTVGKHFIKCSDSCIQVKALRQVTDPRRSYVGAKGWLIPLLYQGILISKNDFGQMNRVLLFRPHILGVKNKFIYIKSPPITETQRVSPTVSGCPDCLQVLTCHYSIQWLHSAYHRLTEI